MKTQNEIAVTIARAAFDLSIDAQEIPGFRGWFLEKLLEAASRVAYSFSINKNKNKKQ